MTRIITKHILRKSLILFIGGLFLSIGIMKLTASAKTGLPYYIKVNKQQNCVTVYEMDKKGKYTLPVKSMACSTGSDTPLGTYNTKVKYRWKLLMGDVWGQYSTRIVGGILFHSVWYYKMDETTLSAAQYNKLGTSASHGCIRLTVEDSKWIYDNCPLGTTVEIYNAKTPGPLGKPYTIKIPAGTGWDPTDPSIKNPYKGKTPSLKGLSNKSITWGSKTDLLKGVKAFSTTGTDITDDIKVEGKVNVYKAGKYKIKYSVSDAIGRSAQKVVTITVKVCKENPRIEGVTDRYTGADTIIDRDFALQGVTAYLSVKKLSDRNIKIKITQDTDNSYRIDYSVKTANKRTGKAQAVIYIDSTPPVIDGIYFRELSYKQFMAGKDEIKKLALKDIKVEDDFFKISKDKVKVTVEAKEDYAYIVTYKVSDEAGNVFSETVQFTYFKGIRIEGVANHTGIPSGTEITEDYVKQGISAINTDNEECTDLLTVKINTADNILYQVIYTITNKDDKMISMTAFYLVDGEPVETDETAEAGTGKENSTKQVPPQDEQNNKDNNTEKDSPKEPSKDTPNNMD